MVYPFPFKEKEAQVYLILLMTSLFNSKFDAQIHFTRFLKFFFCYLENTFIDLFIKEAENTLHIDI